ncbi:MAG: hypothetical protein JNK82_42765 [Myxococcaceae bacterium]|nr:hypothetical protein [Myxococcaceae bacterium]
MREAAAHSVAYLRSDAARASIAKDPYWPKWHSPWWHVMAVREAGFEVPREALVALCEAAERHYLRSFPRAPEVLPPGKSPKTDVVCFCALATLLEAAEGVATVSWADDFIVRYQLPDGGWNCDEHSHVSSIVSTVPVLEYLHGRPALRQVAERGLEYLLWKQLFRSQRSGAVLDPAWLVPSVPRFYEYDLLRGLLLLKRYGVPPPTEALEALNRTELRCWPLSAAAREGNGVESSFPLLEALALPQNARPLLDRQLAAL